MRRYHEWLARQQTDAADTAEAAWRTALAGLDGATLVAPGTEAAALPTLPQRLTAELPAATTAELTDRARMLGVTVNTVVRGAWALVLAELTGRTDVVFGATVSVRPPELPGVEEMVGPLINTVPVRVRVTGEDTLAGLLTRVQSEQTELADHTFLGPSVIRRLAGAGPLYDTSMVFENYPRTAAGAAPSGGGLPIVGLFGGDAYHYPLKLMAAPGERLYLEVSHRTEAVTADQAARVLERLQQLLAVFVGDPHTRLGDLLPACVGAPPGPRGFGPGPRGAGRGGQGARPRGRPVRTGCRSARAGPAGSGRRLLRRRRRLAPRAAARRQNGRDIRRDTGCACRLP